MDKYIKNIATYTLTAVVAVICITIVCCVTQWCLGIIWSNQLKNTAIKKSEVGFQKYTNRADCTLEKYDEVLNMARFECSDGDKTVWIP